MIPAPGNRANCHSYQHGPAPVVQFQGRILERAVTPKSTREGPIARISTRLGHFANNEPADEHISVRADSEPRRMFCAPVEPVKRSAGWSHSMGVGGKELHVGMMPPEILGSAAFQGGFGNVPEIVPVTGVKAESRWQRADVGECDRVAQIRAWSHNRVVKRLTWNESCLTRTDDYGNCRIGGKGQLQRRRGVKLPSSQ